MLLLFTTKFQDSNVLMIKRTTITCDKRNVPASYKCEKAKVKFGEETTHHRRLENLIKAMNISKGLIEDQLD